MASALRSEGVWPGVVEAEEEVTLAEEAGAEDAGFWSLEGTSFWGVSCPAEVAMVAWSEMAGRW